jgi:hypothetical protein
VVEDLILSEFILTLLLHIFYLFAVVGRVEIVELLEFNYTVFVRVDFLEQAPDLTCL